MTVQSFDWRALKWVKERATKIPVACLAVKNFTIDEAWYNLQPARDGPSPWLAGLDFDDYEGNVSCLVKALGGDIVSPYYREIEKKDVKEAHCLGLKIIPWTVNDPRVMEKLIQWEVDGIITDKPDVLTVTSHEAKTHLSRLINKVLRGEEVIIARGKKPLVRIVALKDEQPLRELGYARRKITISEVLINLLRTSENIYSESPPRNERLSLCDSL